MITVSVACLRHILPLTEHHLHLLEISLDCCLCLQYVSPVQESTGKWGYSQTPPFSHFFGGCQGGIRASHKKSYLVQTRLFRAPLGKVLSFSVILLNTVVPALPGHCIDHKWSFSFFPYFYLTVHYWAQLRIVFESVWLHVKGSFMFSIKDTP